MRQRSKNPTDCCKAKPARRASEENTTVQRWGVRRAELLQRLSCCQRVTEGKVPTMGNGACEGPQQLNNLMCCRRCKGFATPQASVKEGVQKMQCAQRSISPSTMQWENSDCELPEHHSARAQMQHSAPNKLSLQPQMPNSKMHALVKGQDVQASVGTMRLKKHVPVANRYWAAATR
jgi:hypothetical protein